VTGPIQANTNAEWPRPDDVQCRGCFSRRLFRYPHSDRASDRFPGSTEISSGLRAHPSRSRQATRPTPRTRH
jgi:hypothetical protein